MQGTSLGSGIKTTQYQTNSEKCGRVVKIEFELGRMTAGVATTKMDATEAIKETGICSSGRGATLKWGARGTRCCDAA